MNANSKPDLPHELLINDFILESQILLMFTLLLILVCMAYLHILGFSPGNSIRILDAHEV